MKRRRLMLPVVKALAPVLPALKVPIRSYLDWEALIDRRAGAFDIERRLVSDGYLQDPDFDKWYPLSHVMSLLTTPPPGAVAELSVPTMFLVADEGPTPAYMRTLYASLPPVKKRLCEIDGSVYWMLSHPNQAAEIVCRWFDETV